MKIALLLTTMLYSLIAIGAPKVYESYDFYEIFPSDISSLNQELDLKAHTKADNKLYRAQTQWQIELSYQWEAVGDNCRISNVDTVLNVTYTMPKLFSDGLDQGIEAKFNRYYKALMNHENGHKQQGLQAAKELSLIIRNMPSMSSCKKLQQRVSEKSNMVIKKYQELDKDFDRYTVHGRSQGAYLI